MALGRPLSPLTLIPAEQQQLLEWARRPKTAQALALRARIVLLSGVTQPFGDKQRVAAQFEGLAAVRL